MTTTQSNKERMGDTIANILRNNAAAYASSTTFIAFANLHTINLGTVRKWKNLQEEGMEIIGINRNKKAYRYLIAFDAAIIIAGITNYANFVKNNEIKSSVDFTQSFLEQCKETRFTSCCSQVLKVAQAHASSIAAYDITPAMITNFEADLRTFESMMTKGKTKQVQVSVFTKNLAASIKAMMFNINTSMVLGIKSFRNSAPDFVNEFTTGKRIPQLSGTATGVHGRVTNKDTEQRLKGIIVEIPELGLSTSTSSTGMFEFKRLPMGNYTIRFRAPGYMTTELPLFLVDGKLKVMDVTIQKQGVPQLANV